MKKGVGSGSESISQRYRSGDPDPDLHQNVTDPQHCRNVIEMYRCLIWPLYQYEASLELSG